MDCMEEARALKSSFCTETATKTATQQAILDDIWCVAGLPSDDFLVDDFFNLPNEEIDEKISRDKNYSENNNHQQQGGDEEEKERDSCGSLSSGHDPVVVLDSAHFSAHLGIPDDDMQELELWSHLMDDSIPEPMLTYPKPSMDGHNKKTGFTLVNRVEPFKKHRVERASFFPTAVPVKPRSKRLRSSGTRSWFSSGSPPKTESSSSSSSPQSPVSTLLFAPPVHEPGMFFMYAKPPLKKPKKKPAPSIDGETGWNSSVQRRCTHCQVTKTPQWRAGPNGPKTLCNACGVRFKSGRLFPEYRPACSPTFSSEVHSNSHRKVLEMRRQKEMTEPSTGSAQRVSSS
ncbi:hypothetical protein vseg_012695 [Gypsophila vaccaria]